MAADLSRVEAADRQRDNRLRATILRALHRARVSARSGLHGRTLMDHVEATALPGDEIGGDRHGLGLVRDLVNGGYVVEQDTRTRRTQLFGMEYLFFAITAKGSDLVEERIAADPMIDDERNLEE